MIDLETLPNNPGCYQFLNKNNQIIYIGKAKNLKKRVKSYFQKNNKDEKTKKLVENIKDVKFITTNTEIEALILENNLIKKHYPKYNINLKDDKRYAYIRLTDEKFPRLIIARNKKQSGKYFGPFTSAETRDYILSTLIKTFQIRTCKKLPKRECLRYHINLCSAPCINKIKEKDYLIQISNAKEIMKGKSKPILKKLNEDMKNQSKIQNYEKALVYRNQINAIEWLNNKQTMEREKKYDEDIINYIRKNNKIYLIMFNIFKGILENKQEFEFDDTNDFINQFLPSYYSENTVPKEIILPKKPSSTVIEYLELKRKSKIKITVPKLGEKRKLLDLVKTNIHTTYFGDQEKLDDLQKKLKLNESPEIIECFDISHLGGTNTVASMVRFRRSRPDKSNYRRFKIKTVNQIDDFKSIAEVVRRRYRRLLNENKLLPNLIVIDGGKGQLTAALAELKQLGVNIPTIALAKKFEEIFLPGLSIPIRLDKKSKALKLLMEIRDEAHRFAVKYNRLLRRKKLLED